MTTNAASLEYLGHAAFALTSPAGVRVLIDPYSSLWWLGYKMPRTSADVVAVTHPHADHCAVWQVAGDPVVFDGPVEARLGDVTIRGHVGRHSSAPGGERIAFRNTMFELECAGVRLVHAGDTAPGLPPELMRPIRSADVLILPIDAGRHHMSEDEAYAFIAGADPVIVVPCHFALHGLSDRSTTLGPVEPWARGRGATFLGSHLAELRAGDLRRDTWVFDVDRTVVRPWPEPHRRARELLVEIRGSAASARASTLLAIAGAVPELADVQVEVAGALFELGDLAGARDAARQTLEARPAEFFEPVQRAHILLGQIADLEGRRTAALRHYSTVAADPYCLPWIRSETERFLLEPFRLTAES